MKFKPPVFKGKKSIIHLKKNKMIIQKKETHDTDQILSSEVTKIIFLK